jgi:single-strand DNA-binding protein
MANFHQTVIAGHLGRDVEMRYMPSGDAVANFSVAVTESWKSKDGEKKESTTWYRVNAFGKLAEICAQYLKKGSGVLVAGKMQSRKYEKDGVERESWELRADTMQMLGSGSGSGGDSASAPAQPRANSASKPAQGGGGGCFADMGDDIPFAPIGRGPWAYVI